MIPLAAFEEITDASGTPPRIEGMLPTGVRARQLLARTLLLGMLLVLADHRPVPARPGPRHDPRADRDARRRDRSRRHPRRLRLLPPRRRRLALPLRAAGAQLVQDLHPHDRGPKGTHDGAIISNGNPYCPRTPRPLPERGPLARTATGEQAADHDRQTAELVRCQLGRITADDANGHHRVQCPAAMGKIR